MQPGLFPTFAGCSCRNAALLGSSGSAKPSSAPLRMPQAGIAGTDRVLEAGLLPPSFHCPFPAFGEWHQVCLCAGPCCGAKQEVLGTPPVAPNITFARRSCFGRDIKVA